MIYHEAIHQSTGGMTNAQAQQRERIILRGGERGGWPLSDLCAAGVV